ncbi:MAG: hypothetical protein Fur0041_15690 [Bacteroidia bacterium]
MRTVIVTLTFLLSLNSLNAASFVYQDGRVIKDSTGKEIKLKGVNIGGWLLWEGWIWGGGLTRESKIAEGLEKIGGTAEFKAFRKDIYKNYFSEADVKAISEAGMNVIRIPFNHRIFDPAYCEPGGFTVLDSVLFWCKKYGVYAVLDLHAAPGGQNPLFISDPEKNNLWKDEKHRIQTVKLWESIALRYRNNAVIAGYDLLNEPYNPGKKGNEALVHFYDTLIHSIRKIDSLHMLIIEGNNYAKDFDFFTKTPDNNMMFEFHLYNFLGGNPEDKLREYLKLGERLDVPVWCGEWGENNYDMLQKTLNAFAAAENEMSGWCFWTWKKVLSGNPALNSIPYTASWLELIKWCSTQSPSKMPSHDNAAAAMADFGKSVRYAATTHDDRLMQMLKNNIQQKH